MDLEKRQTVECTLYFSAFDTQTLMLTTLERYIADVRSGKHKKAVEKVQAYLAASENEKAEAGKKRLPLLVPGGAMAGGRKLEHMVRYSGCICFDLDDVLLPPEQILSQAVQLGYVKAGHISPSHTENKLFVLVDSDQEHHLQAFEQVRAMIENDLSGVTVDISGKDANRGCFASYDPDAFYKEVAEVVHVPQETVPVAKKAPAVRASSYPDNSLSNYIDKFEANNPFAGGGRHSFVLKLASALNSAGFDENEVMAECLRRYVEPGFAEKEIRGIVADVYRRYRSSHGSNPWCPPTASTGQKSLTSVTSLTPISENPTTEGDSPLGFDIDPDEVGLPHFDRAVIDRFPGLLSDVLKVAADDREYDLMLLSSLTVLSTIMPGVSGMLKKQLYKPPFYTLIIGPSGSGKGCINVVRKLADPWQDYIFDISKAKVKEYEEQKELSDNYKAQVRAAKGKKPVGLPPEEPVPVCQKRLHMSGYTTTARMIEQLDVNSPYASFLYETELESVNNTIMQDFGGYSYVLNQAFQHERIGCSSKTNGTSFIEFPELGFLATGTPGMLLKLIPSTESGLYSRLLIYRITGRADYQPLTSVDDTMCSVRYFERLGQRVLDMAVHLEKSPTFVVFSDKQRKRLDRYFEREYNNVRVFGNDDVASVVLRHRLIIFRIAMTLTGIRKGETKSTAEEIEILDDDFDIAFHIGTRCLSHSLLVSTSLKHSDTNQRHKLPDAQVDLFDVMPDEFKTSDIIDEAGVRGISRSSVFRMLKKAQEYSLVVLVSTGYYRKTEKGKNVKK
ncbi:DUF3987 domain-containing protein [Parabacteroides goldsteinii]|uniref:Primase C-terminal 1 domain-containing protein n=13 Tax=Tannerellaceae TaxID=2005525 RepID=S0GSC3_9BACT|nr:MULTISPECIES: DUF3987 domain-containing protein [Parabacteroides]EOS17048.1 hypothetical protein C803_02943 [Parabacteroides goldsteinii dnLKV18]KAI4359420.1 hypothetical protein C825_001460 [Parabacteroides sp. ASF519]MDZ3927477.1 DUF3987 domain-containing protein [Parabacteroides goldsteinii]